MRLNSSSTLSVKRTVTSRGASLTVLRSAGTDVSTKACGETGPDAARRKTRAPSRLRTVHHEHIGRLEHALVHLSHGGAGPLLEGGTGEVVVRGTGHDLHLAAIVGGQPLGRRSAFDPPDERDRLTLKRPPTMADRQGQRIAGAEGQ